MTYIRSGYALADIMAQYIDDPHRIQREVHAAVDTTIGIEKINHLRKRWLKKPLITRLSAIGPSQADDSVRVMERGSLSLLKALYDAHPYVFEAAERSGRLVVRP